MSELTKKRLIAALLLVSCIISAWLLFITPANDNRQLQSFAQADSLLRLTLSDFNIPPSQISTTSVRIDSAFSRKQFSVRVPTAFSKTQLHAALQQQLAPYNLDLPARITFPEKNMSIHLLYNGTVVRTLRLSTDKDLRINRSFARLIVAFEDRPPAYLIEVLGSFGEPIPAAIIRQAPVTIPEWWDEVKQQLPDLYVWPKTAADENLLANGRQNPSAVLEPLQKTAPGMVLLHFYESGQAVPASLRGTSFSFIDARDTFILNPEAGRSGFSQTFRAMVRQSRNGETPLGIIIATEASLEWTRQELNTFKKGGLTITRPQKVIY